MPMKTVAIFTTTRAEFGLFSALIKAIQKTAEIQVMLFVGGAHLKKETGNTIKEIINQGFKIDATFDYLLDSDNEVSITKSLGIATSQLADIFEKFTFDFVCVLGDRYELLSIVTAAIIYKKPIIHLHGGEKTEGAIDEQIRHMITKASHIHFVICDEYAQNVRRMGESEWRIFNTGALAVDNISQSKLIDKATLFYKLHLNSSKPTVMLTYHPVTLEYDITPVQQIQNLFGALQGRGFQVVVTSPNVDKDYTLILNAIKNYVNENRDYHYFDSLGVMNYLSLVSHCEFVIGNSSSGIIEIPYFKIPTINIGNRQKGRIRHESIIDTDYSKESIIHGIEQATNDSFRRDIQNMNYKFGSGNVAETMVNIIKGINMDSRLIQKTLDF
jgi:GDP/UDP-N,N'-diacetylbacillosamine 2-epimerase (hydrolysing)